MEMMSAYFGTLLTAWISAWNDTGLAPFSHWGIREDLLIPEEKYLRSCCVEKESKNLKPDRLGVDPSSVT